MPTLTELLKDPNYTGANPATKQAIFDKYSVQDQNFTGANDATKDAIRQRFGIGMGVTQEPEVVEKPPEAGFSAKDIGIAGVRGVLGVSKAVTDVFGADNDASKKLSEYSTEMGKLYTPQRQKEIAYYEQKQKEAEESGKPVEEIKAALQSIKAAPLQATAEAVGSIVPNLLSLFIPVVGEVRGAMMARTAFNAFVGILEGTGSVKGSIYDTVKEDLIKNKVPEEEAARLASEAQSYTGKNFDQILLGAGIGGVTGKFGVEELLNPKAAKLAKKAAAIGSEMFTEAGQASQEQIAGNLASQREGLDVDLMRGVAGAATKEGVMGALGAGTVGAISPGARAEELPPEISGPLRGSNIIEQQLNELKKQPQTPEREEQINDLTNKLDQVRQEEGKIDQYKDEFAQMDEDELSKAIKNLNEEQNYRNNLLKNPDLVKEYAEENGIDPEEAQRQLQDLYAENRIRQRAYQELTQGEVVDTGEQLTADQMTQDQIDNLMSTASTNLSEAYKGGTLTVEDAVRLINKSKDNFVLQDVGLELIKNRDAEVVENMLEAMKSEASWLMQPDVTEQTIKDTLDNMEFLEFIESMAKQSIDEQNEIKKDIASLQEGQVKVAQKYGIDSASQEDMEQMADYLKAELDTLINMSENPDVMNRFREAIERDQTAEDQRKEKERKEKEKEQQENADLPDDILEKMDEHAFGKKLGAKYHEKYKYFEQQGNPYLGTTPDKKTKSIAKAVRSNNVAGIADELAKSENPAIRMVSEKMRNLNTTVQQGFQKQYQKKTWAGYWDPDVDRVFIRKKHAGSEHTVAHEFLHALTWNAVHYPTAEQKPIIAKLNTLYEHVKKELGNDKKIYGLTNLDEFIAESNSNVAFQYKLSQIKYKNETAWGAFTRTIAQLLGISNVSALTEAIALTEELTSTKLTKGIPSKANQPSPLIFGGKPKKPTPTAKGQSVMNSLNQMGRSVKPQPPSYVQRVQSGWKQASQNPQLTKQSAKDSFRRFADKVETMVFSSDAALNNEIRRSVMASTIGMQGKIGAMLEVSLSQTVHADAMANLHMMEGKIVYDKKNYKWVAEKSKSNFVELAKQVDKIAEKYGLTKEEAMLVGHTAFEAKRLKSIVDVNKAIDATVTTLRSEASVLMQDAKAAEQAGEMDKAENKRNQAAKKRAEAIKERSKKKIPHMDDAEIQTGMDLFKSIPELNGLVDTWQEMRKNTADVLVSSGLWSKEEANFLLENIDYVPFFREEQIEQGKGPKEFIRGLQVQARDPRMKGSKKPVNDIFDNMARWMQYAVNRSVRNKSAQSLIDAAVRNKLGKKVSKFKRGGNNVNVWRNGKQEFYELDDPMWVDAFRGLESVAIPALNVFSKMANVLRQSVVMYPLFSIAQIPQDSFAAMFSSGLKPQFALRIPVLAVKEFLKTLTKRSATHNELKKYGAVGVTDFSSAVGRMNSQLLSELKGPPGFVGKIKAGLTHFAMSADNAVRQAVYEATIQSGKTQAEALEKAFQVINFRNRGSSKLLALAGQVIPFFNAYLAAQHVAYKTISGTGISPDERKAALGTLAATTGSVMAMSLIYAMMNADDDDYKNKPAAVRDRLLMIPGTGGLAIPLRMDLFTFPKILTEHTYLLMTDKGYEDSRKMKDSLKNALANAVFSPTLVPQAVKPLVEVGINYDFFQGRPLVGTFQKQLELERQFTDSTSELGKILGNTGLVSPIAADHLIRGMFGSVGGLVLYITNPILHSDPEVPRPSLGFKDALAALPGTSGFVSREYETALKTDFYVLRDEVAKVVNTINDMKTRSPDDIDNYLEKEGVEERYGLKGGINKITGKLSKIRKAITQITNDGSMSSDEKHEAIMDLKKTERELLEGIDIKDLRQEAKL